VSTASRIAAKAAAPSPALFRRTDKLLRLVARLGAKRDGLSCANRR
jgi:hypothetical protein